MKRILLASIVMLTIASVGNAQGCSNPSGCATCAHTAPWTYEGLMLGTHTDCRVCPVQGCYAIDCHGPCQQTFGAAHREAYAQVLAAADQGNVAAVIAAAPWVHDFVRYNRNRRALQIIDCSGRKVIATLYVPSELLVSAARRLQPSHDFQSLDARTLLAYTRPGSVTDLR